MASSEKDRIKSSGYPKKYWAVYNGQSVGSCVEEQIPLKTIPKSYSESFVERFNNWRRQNGGIKRNRNSRGRFNVPCSTQKPLKRNWFWVSWGHQWDKRFVSQGLLGQSVWHVMGVCRGICDAWGAGH